MDTFVVRVCKGIVMNQKRDTSRMGYWVPVTALPRGIAARFGADRDTARPKLAFDLHARDWRDMKNAQMQEETFCTATVVQMDDGRLGIALLDF